MSTTHRQAKALKAVIYLRLSVSKEESVSIEKTREECVARCESEGFEVVEILTDDGFSGGIRRDKADRALKMLRSGEADVLVVWKFDRWSRQGIMAVGDLMETLMQTAPRTRFIALKDGLDSTQQFFPLMASFFAEQARIERENTSLRVTGTIALLATKGRYYGGITPFGWTPKRREDGPGYFLALCDRQYPVLREAIDRVISGEPIHAISKDFDSRIRHDEDCPRGYKCKCKHEVFPSPEGVGWHANFLRRLLRSEVLRGYMIFHGTPVIGDDGRPIRPNHAAVSDEEWYALQEALDKRSYKNPLVDRYTYLLKGIATCAHCGKNLGRRKHQLACSRHSKEIVCPGPVIVMDVLDQYVTTEFLARYGDSPVMEETEIKPDMSRVREIVEALDIVGKKIMAADTEAEEDELLMVKRSLRAELKELETKDGGESIIIRQETGRTYRETWVDSNVEQQRALLMSRIARVEVAKALVHRRADGKRKFHPERVNIEWLEEERIDLAA